jgi:hypothetical protein
MSSNKLKVLGLITMLIDHIGLVIYPQYIFLRVIGRICFPLFAFQSVVGFRCTKNKKAYAFNLFIFGLISQIPYSLLFHVQKLNIFFTLALGIVMLINFNGKMYKKILIVIAALLSAQFFSVSYGIYGILLVLLFHIFYGEKLKILISNVVLNVLFITTMPLQIYSIFALVFILNFNYKLGVKLTKNLKYLFYVFYPAHLLALLFVSKYM